MSATPESLYAVLDELPLTEEEYLESDRALPMVLDIVRLAEVHLPKGRLILIGGSPLLSSVLGSAGYAVERWLLPADAPSWEAVPRVEGAVRLLDLSEELPSLEGARAVLLAGVMESLPKRAAELLEEVATGLGANARVLIVVRNARSLKLRWQKLRGDRGGAARKGAVELGKLPELLRLSHLAPLASGHVRGPRPWRADEGLSLLQYLRKRAATVVRLIRPQASEFLYAVSRPATAHLQLLPAQPSVSIIVPTYNRGSLLPKLFEGLLDQRYPSILVELIVVDNSSTDGTSELMAEWKTRLPFSLTYIVQPNQGPAVARNRGAAQARGDILAFIDSDCVPGPYWISAGVEYFSRPLGLLTGPVYPRESPGSNFFSHRAPAVFFEDAYFMTANIFYRRSVFEDAGGFDEVYGITARKAPACGEDVELGWRVKRLGYPTTFGPDLPVYHASTAQSALDWLAEAVRAKGMASLVAAVPELRRSGKFRYKIFWNLSMPFYPLAAGVVLALVTHQLVFAVIGAVPWLSRSGHVWQFRTLRRTVLSPVRFGFMTLHLLVLVGTLWYGAVRARTVIL